jgi:hypothetical protein
MHTIYIYTIEEDDFACYSIQLKNQNRILNEHVNNVTRSILMPHGFWPGPSFCSTTKIAAEALAKLIAEAEKPSSVISAKQSTLASTYAKAARRYLISLVYNEWYDRVNDRLVDEYDGIMEKHSNARLSSAIDTICQMAIRKNKQYRPINEIRRDIFRGIVAKAGEIRWGESGASYGGGGEVNTKMEARIARLLTPAFGDQTSSKDFPSQGSLREELGKIEGKVALMVMKRQLMSVKLPWGLYRCGRNAVLLYTGEDSANGLVDALLPHKERIDAAMFYFADSGPYSKMELIAKLVGCVRNDASTIVMNCTCNAGHEYGPDVVAKATGRTDVRFWCRKKHDMENVALGQIAYFAKYGRLSLVEPSRNAK